MTSNDRALDDACGKLGELLKPAYISTLSPGVSDMEERLRYVVDEQMAPPGLTVFFREAADALASLSAQLAVKDSALRLANEQWESAIETLRKSKGRAETAEASLSAAQEENERLRKALIDVRALLSADYGSDGRVVGVSHEMDGLRRMVSMLDATLSTPSKEDKT